MQGHVMTIKTKILKGFLFWLLAVGGLVSSFPAMAQTVDLPTAAGSPIAGISFDDRPLLLPVQRNFQMAMLTASSELGRSCGRMEAYGWRLSNEEQKRVNQIFNNTVDRMRAQGFAVESKTANSVSRDVTLFTADRQDKHLIFLWSAGEIGLVMVLCETSAPLSPIPENRVAEASQPANFPGNIPTSETLRSRSVAPSRSSIVSHRAPVQLTRAGRPAYEDFTPLGAWIGDYTCAQGTTGATLSIEKLKGDQFEGLFSFYPTAKNPYVPKGKYKVFGEYDADSQRILINPGKWIDRPQGYYSTIMIGSFDPTARTFSGFFQGINGCTSFEAKFDKSDSLASSTSEAKKKPAAKTSKKKAPKKKKPVKPPAKPKPPTEAETSEPVPSVPTLPEAAPSSSGAGEPSSGLPTDITIGAPIKLGL